MLLCSVRLTKDTMDPPRIVATRHIPSLIPRT